MDSDIETVEIKKRRSPRRKADQPPRWPEMMRIGTVAEFLDVHRGSAAMLVTVLSAHFGLKIHPLSAGRIRPAELLAALGRAMRGGRQIQLHTHRRIIRIGDREYPV